METIQGHTRSSKYALHTNGRRETWDETITRVMGMHREKYRGLKDDPVIHTWMQMIEDALRRRDILGSQRSLQFGGKPILVKEARMYNCVKRNTEFVTVDGVKSFNDFQPGDRVEVLTHAGRFKNATVVNHGQQEMYRLTFTRGNAIHVVNATADHRWLLRDGSVTDHLKVGDRPMAAPKIFQDFDYYSAEPDERAWWAYGMVYGDGTLVKDKGGEYKHSMVRLCGAKAAYLERFTELGFSHSFPPSCDGDPIVYTGRYLKTLPQAGAPHRLLRAFVRGYLDADGHKNRTVDAVSPFTGIQTSDGEAAEFIRKMFPTAGVYIVSEAEVDKDTNFGHLDAAAFNLTQGQGKTGAAFELKMIENIGVHEAWCLEVEEDHSFVLPFGMVTGNCMGSVCDRPRFFSEMFWLQLCGCGTGASAQFRHVNRLPLITKPEGPEEVYVIPDTIEGWADAAGVLLSTYFTADQQFPEWFGKRVKFDPSLIRERGAPLSSGAKAPGPAPLMKALESVRALLDRILEEASTVTTDAAAMEQYLKNGTAPADYARRVLGDAALTVSSGGTIHGTPSTPPRLLVRLRPIHAFDVAMFFADAVLAGGVRRSASLFGFSADDNEMMTAKADQVDESGKVVVSWREVNPQRERANISVVRLRSSTTFEQYHASMQYARVNGEPAVLWVDDYDQICNPCAEIGFWSFLEDATQADVDALVTPGSRSGVYEDGHFWTGAPRFRISGWQACNLSTINMTTVRNASDFIERCGLAAALGTFQAGYTRFDYLDLTSQMIVEREALVGVSMTGMWEKPDIAFDAETLRQGAEMVREVNKNLAKRIGINQAARTTCVKPEGTASLLLATFASGIHAPICARGIRHIRSDTNEPEFKLFEKYNPHAVFDLAPTDRNFGSTRVMAIPFDTGDVQEESDIPALEMLRLVLRVQEHWVEAGKNAGRCVKPFVSHNVSCSVPVDVDEWEDAARYIYENRAGFVGVTLTGRLLYQHFHLAPYTPVLTWDELFTKYGKDVVLEVNDLVSELLDYGRDVWSVVDKFTPGASFTSWFTAILEDLHSRRLDVVPLVKEVELARRYDELVQYWVDVPWDEMREEEDNVDFQQSPACVGGSCDIDWELMKRTAAEAAAEVTPIEQRVVELEDAKAGK